jgi:hypothetical protein
MLQDVSGVHGFSPRVHLRLNRDETWTHAAFNAFVIPMLIDLSVSVSKDNDVIRCKQEFEHPEVRKMPTATKNVLGSVPRVRLSFKVGITVVMSDQVAQIQVANITPASALERELSARWGISVVFKEPKPTFWLHNQRCDVESVIPGQMLAMTEAMRSQLEVAKPPATYNVLLTIIGKEMRVPMNVQVNPTASWDDLIQ